MGDSYTNELTVDNQKIASVVEVATLQVPGVNSFSTRFYDSVVDEISRPFGIQRTPGITIKNNKEGLTLHLYLIAELDRNMAEVGEQVRHDVYYALKSKLAIEAYAVNVRIEGVIIPGEVN